MKTTTRNFVIFLFIGALGVSLSSGCRKKQDTLAVITVLNTNNEPVEGAEVVLYGQSTINQPANVVLYDTSMTNVSGEALFDFNDVYQLGQAGVAVLNIEAYKDGAEGSGIIKIEQETTSEETVFIQ
jgi:hypothetical protein